MKQEIKAQRNKWIRNRLIITNRRGEIFTVKVPKDQVAEAKMFLWRVQKTNGKEYVVTGYNQKLIKQPQFTVRVKSIDYGPFNVGRVQVAGKTK